MSTSAGGSLMSTLGRTVVRRLLCGALLLLPSVAQAGPQLGLYRWDAPSGPSNANAFGQWLGMPVAVGSAYTPKDKWENIQGAFWQLSSWSQWVKAKQGRDLSFAVAMFPRDAGSLASCAAGQYDVYWRNLASNLTYYGLNSAYLRLGWEMDGSWQPWGAPAGSGKEASFAGCFRRIVQVMRQAQPANQWKFVFNPTVDTWPTSAYLETIWPGDAYVDVVGVDIYDQSWVRDTYPYPSTCDAACRLARQQKSWAYQAARLNTLRSFALAHGKPMAFPEWGVIIRSDGHGGGDNPYFIQKMHEFIVDPDNYVAFHSYFNTSAWASTGNDNRLTDPVAYDNPTGPTRLPNAAARFKQLFGPTSIANTAPNVSITSPTAGQTVWGTVAYGAKATDSAGVSRVEFFIDSTALPSDVSSPYGGNLDTTRLVNGTHVLKAIAYDAQGLSATSQVAINVQNPRVTFVAPAAGATMSGYYKDSSGCEVTGTNIVRVVFYMDNTQLNTESYARWQCILDTRRFANGTHTLRAVAYNAAGASVSVMRSVNVKN